MSDPGSVSPSGAKEDLNTASGSSPKSSAASSIADGAASAENEGVIAPAQEVVPIEMTEVIPDVQLHPPDDASDEGQGGAAQDESGGAWSTTITPIEEIHGFDLRIQDHEDGQREEVEAPRQTIHRKRPAHLSHSRVESLPPQRYSEFEVESVDSSEDTSRRVSSFLDSKVKQRRRPSALSNASMEEEVDLDARNHYHCSEGNDGLRELSETEQAGLDFVDVALDTNKSIYGSSGAYAAKSRTSLEIRSDFISSDGARGSAADLSRNGSGQDLGVSPAGDSNASVRRALWGRSSSFAQGGHLDGEAAPIAGGNGADPDTSRTATTPQRQASNTSVKDDIGSANMTPSTSLGSLTDHGPRKVAGRYRGRISTPPSPATSPQLERSSVNFGKGHSEGSMPGLPRRFSGGMTMTVANDDGEVEVIDLSAEDYLSSQGALAVRSQYDNGEAQLERSKTSDRAGSNGDANYASEVIAPVTNQTDGAVVSASQQRSKSSRGGRSAGPPPINGDDHAESSVDVRQAMTAEVGVSSSAGRGGRSAGPILEGVDPQPTSPPPSDPSTLVATGRSKGRSAGPSPSEASSTSPREHSRKPSKGPSALESHISRTRQTTLPPKARNEDQRHLKDFELMMKESKLAEAKKVKEDEIRLRKKEEEQREAIKVWEGEILKDWRVARTSKRLKDYWWRGSPPPLRGRAWQLAIGNAQMLPRNLCQTTKARVAELKSSGKWPPDNPLASDGGQSNVEFLMEQDIDRTLPSLKLFQREGGVMYEDLKEILECLVLIRADRGHELATERKRDGEITQGSGGARNKASKAPCTPELYASGLALLSATLLLNLSQAETLVAILNLIPSKAWLRSLYSMDPRHLSESDPFERVLDTFLADQLPKVYANMQARGVRPSAYARDWVRQLFVPLLPFDVVCRLWDNIFLEENDALIFRVCLALVSLLSSRLYAPDAAELTSILQGKNRAALAVWYRDLQFSSASSKDSVSAQVVASLPPSTTPLSSTSPLSAIFEHTGIKSTHSAHGSTSTASGEEESNGESLPSTASVVEAPPSWVPRDCLFTTYGINEDNLFRALEEQVGIDGWFKETTLERLIERELGG